MVGKRSSKATGKIKPKRITSKQRRARKVNIEVARRYRKKGRVSKSEGAKRLGDKLAETRSAMFPKGTAVKGKKWSKLERKHKALERGIDKLAGKKKSPRRKPMYVHYD